MSAVKWVSKGIALAIHDEQISEHGGSTGVRDINLLESAIARPQNIEAYKEKPTIEQLAASYSVGIAKNHPFVDGNKRTTFVVMELFLLLNGYELIANDEDCVLTMLKIASSDMSEEELVKWIGDNIQN